MKAKDKGVNTEYPFFNIGSCKSDYGFAWQARFCEKCYRDMNKCNIIGLAMGGIDWKHQLVIKDGQEVCLSFEDRHEHIRKPRINHSELTIFDDKE
jgi:hypothetical protein